MVIPFPFRRGKLVELDVFHDPKTSIDLFIFEAVERGDYAIIDVHYSLDEARKKIEQLRREGATVVEVGPAVEACS